MDSGSSPTLVVEAGEEHGLSYPAVTTFTSIYCPGIHVLLLIKTVLCTYSCSLRSHGNMNFTTITLGHRVKMAGKRP
jgi:hypothetical protein